MQLVLYEAQHDMLEQAFDCITVPQVDHLHTAPHQRHDSDLRQIGRVLLQTQHLTL